MRLDNMYNIGDEVVFAGVSGRVIKTIRHETIDNYWWEYFLDAFAFAAEEDDISPAPEEINYKLKYEKLQALCQQLSDELELLKQTSKGWTE